MRHAHRLQHFVQRGEITTIPTRWQVLQGELAMWAYVISPDVTAEDHYDGAVLGHPVLRQPVILSEVGWQHVNIGTGLSLSVHSLCRHLQFTQHRGMPVWDLQLLHCYPDGLTQMRSSTEALRHPKTWMQRMTRAKLDLVVPNADRYLDQFLGSDGWIAMAERYEYRTEAAEAMPPEYVSLTAFLSDCAERFPATSAEVPLGHWPRRLIRQFTRRWREEGGLWCLA